METSIIIPIFLIGLVSSILTELLKVFPKLAETDERKKVMAFMVALVISSFYALSQGVTEGLTLVVGVLTTTFLIYKGIIQPVEELGKSTIRIIKGLIIKTPKA